MKITKLINPFLIILFAVILRLLPHPPNVAPIAAMALFGGAYINKKNALIVPLLAMLISDIFLGFHSTIPFVYGSFVLTGIIGLWLRNHKTVQMVILASFSSSILFFIITNFGVWFVGGLYSKTVNGLVLAYIYALPFFRNTIIGDLLYTGLFFGPYEIIKVVILNEVKPSTRRYLVKDLNNFLEYSSPAKPDQNEKPT